MKRTIYSCNWCWCDTYKKKWLCGSCDFLRYSYEWDHCWCRWQLIWWQAFTTYECAVCAEKISRPNTCRPKLCDNCAKVNQCIYCWERNANRIFRKRRYEYIKMHENIMNKENTSNMSFNYENIYKWNYL